MRKLFVVAITCCLIAGCGKTNQLTNTPHTTPEDNHQAIEVKPEASSGWSSYWKWGVVAFVGITGLILGYRHRGELSSAYHKVRFNYMKNADFRFFPDEPNNHPIDVPNNQNNNPVPEADNLFGVASNAQSQFFNNPQNKAPANNP